MRFRPEKHRDGDIGHVPAESGIVEIDEGAGFSVHQHILGNEVAVDEAEAIAALAELGQAAAGNVGRPIQQTDLAGRQGIEVTIASPHGMCSEEALFVPTVALEGLGRVPVLAVQVDLRGQPAHLLIGAFDEVLFSEGFILDGAERRAADP